MPKFRKKPVVIEAVRWDPEEEPSAYPSWLWDTIIDPAGLDIATGDLAIHTLEGAMLARPGDYIVQGVKGELYPCKPGIFQATYEPVEE